ncbi:hypothetical protein AVEN_189478-1 [Araneus ventricosus]|uniref:DAGKc domain-containing protein n=1 Tax=Araneus ventricosus TaxID=182803 RepID=A0A4Y2MMX9_ARAVE|nr:hypothetical protein AVEN_189478-1 [Araneus ventricosus]
MHAVYLFPTAFPLITTELRCNNVSCSRWDETHFLYITEELFLPLAHPIVYNGLMARPDWKEVVKIPIGVIPGGSGNGLAKAINYAVG